MELVSLGCTGDALEMLVLRRRTGGGLYLLLLLCWILATHPTAHGECGIRLHPAICVCARARVCRFSLDAADQRQFGIVGVCLLLLLRKSQLLHEMTRVCHPLPPPPPSLCDRAVTAGLGRGLLGST